MYMTKLAQLMHKRCAVNILSKLVNSSQKIFIRNKFTISENIRAQMESDVLLFKLEKPTHFVIINLCSGLNCFFWTYLGIFLFKSVKEARKDEEKGQFWKKALESERNYTGILSAISLIFGWSIFTGTLLYTVRSVRTLILHRGGRNLTIITYKLPGFNNTVKVPLSKVSSSEHRSQAKKFIPLKIKDKYFYYLLDVRGEFMNPQLFDFTAGVQRNI